MRVKRTSLAFVAVAVFTAFMLAVPWEQVWGQPFVDRQVYLDYFLYQTNVLDYKEPDNVLTYYTAEALWHFGMREAIDGLGIPINLIFAAISALCIGVFSFYLVQKHGAWSLIFLVNPLLIDLVFSQLRIALALSLLGIAHFHRGRAVVVGLSICSLFIHSAVLVFLFSYFSSYLATILAKKRAWSKIWLYGCLLTIGLFVALIIGPLRELILSYLGDRRAEYLDVSSTFLYSSFWICLLIPLYLQSRNYLMIKDHAFVVSVLSLVAASAVFASYSTRFLAATLPMIISSILSLRRELRVGVLPIFGIYVVFQWVYWLRSA